MAYMKNSEKKAQLSSHENGIRQNKSDEELFLTDYNPDAFERPSVTTDIAVFSVNTESADCYRKNPDHNLSLLLIKRGCHPYMNMWALPGGFIKRGETLEECAMREIKEETSFSPPFIIPVGEFSEPHRDPRGWVISNAFASVISIPDAYIKGGDDAAEAEWFEIEISDMGADREICLRKNDTVLRAKLRQLNSKPCQIKYEITENDGIAFDHAKIIASAIDTLRYHAEDFELVFSFLPEKFTLASLQKMHETIMGVTHLPANFRRKVSELVEETDEYTGGAGHRPARLFRKK